MKHVITRIFPDCPECGAEMILQGRIEGPPSERNPWGRMRQHWHCKECGHDEPEAPGRIEIETHEEVFPNVEP